jgi:hypothetical protein
VSSKPVEAHCRTETQSYSCYGIMQFWSCSVCCGQFGMALGEVPQACPRCAVLFLLAKIDGEIKDLR